MYIGGTLAAQQGDFETAKRRYVESMEIRRALGDRENEANVLNNLGIVARWQNDLDAARTYQEASLAIHEEMGNRWSIGAQLNNLALLAIDDKIRLRSSPIGARIADLARNWRALGNS